MQCCERETKQIRAWNAHPTLVSVHVVWDMFSQVGPLLFVQTLETLIPEGIHVLKPRLNLPGSIYMGSETLSLKLP